MWKSLYTQKRSFWLFSLYWASFVTTLWLWVQSHITEMETLPCSGPRGIMMPCHWRWWGAHIPEYCNCSECCCGCKYQQDTGFCFFLDLTFPPAVSGPAGTLILPWLFQFQLLRYWPASILTAPSLSLSGYPDLVTLVTDLNFNSRFVSQALLLYAVNSKPRYPWLATTLSSAAGMWGMHCRSLLHAFNQVPVYYIMYFPIDCFCLPHIYLNC